MRRKMKRDVPISDLERLYTSHDLAKVGCQGCHGCWDCCQGMGESVILDPLDVYRLERGLAKDFPSLMQLCLELNPVDGVILPNLRMEGQAESCVFLNEEKRCAIHPYRPGLCRLFPLGRYYRDDTFYYFLQQKECKKEPKTKVKISKWLDTPDLKQYEKYVLDWHNFLGEAEQLLVSENDEQFSRDLNVYILENFYAKPYDERTFYEQFSERILKMRKLLKIIKRK